MRRKREPHPSMRTLPQNQERETLSLCRKGEGLAMAKKEKTSQWQGGHYLGTRRGRLSRHERKEKASPWRRKGEGLPTTRWRGHRDDREKDPQLRHCERSEAISAVGLASLRLVQGLVSISFPEMLNRVQHEKLTNGLHRPFHVDIESLSVSYDQYPHRFLASRI